MNALLATMSSLTDACQGEVLGETQIHPSVRRCVSYCALAIVLISATQLRAQSCTSPPLSEPSFYGAGGDTAGVAIGDLDGNGTNDIAVVRPGSNSIAVLFNDGTGAFGPPQALTTGTTPLAVAIADFNHDGFNDLAVANSGSNTISIFLGIGAGAFGSPSTLTTLTQPSAVVTGDFNGDGIVDLAVANKGSNDLQLFYGTGTGSFAAPVMQTSISLIQPVALAVGRLDADNRDDLIVVGNGGTKALIFYETGLGQGYSVNAFTVGSAPVSVALGEFAQDTLHTVDAVVANEGSNNLTVQELSPGGVGPSSATIPLPGPPSSVAVADFNGDHRPDLLVVSRSMNELWLLYNSGPVAFSAPIRYQLSAGAAAVAAGDVNGDGYPDAVASMPTVNGLSVLRGANWPVVSKPYFMVIGDTSGSMSTSTAPTSCGGYPPTRSGTLRCALRELFKSYTDDAEFGLSTYAMRQASCAAACFTSCTYSAFPQETSTIGCGPRTGDATTRAGAFIRVPVRQDNFWTSPAPPDNRSQLNAWVDNACGDNQELFASGSGPLNGALRDMKRYFGGTWSAPDGSVSYSTPLSANDRSCRSVNIILITDGDEACDTQADAVAVAADLYNNGVTVGGQTFKVRTYVINFVGGTPANLDAIASAGGTVSSVFVTNVAQITAVLQTIVGAAVFAANPLETCSGVDKNCNGCSGEGWLQAAAATNSGPACAGSDVQIHANTFPGATYSWSGPNGYIATTQSATISSASAAASGTYTFTATVASCTSVSASTQVVVNAGPDASITAPAQVTAMWSSFASVPNAGIGATYAWSVSGATFTGQGTRSIRFTAGPSGNVSLSAMVQTASGCMASGNRLVTIVSTPVFTDDPLAGGVTIIKAIHLSEVRDAVNMIRVNAGLLAVTWTDDASPGLTVKALHVTQLRDALTPALTALMRSAAYTDPNLAPGDVIKAVHIQEIRDYTK